MDAIQRKTFDNQKPLLNKELLKWLLYCNNEFSKWLKDTFQSNLIRIKVFYYFYC